MTEDERAVLLGIDASRAVTDRPTGTENYSLRIIRELLQAPSSFHFRLYMRALPPPGLFPETGNSEVRAIPFPRLWTHIRLSAEMLARPPDALFVPAHVLPPVHPTLALVTVHDLGYLHFPRAHRTLDRLYLDLSTRWNVRTARVVFADSEATRLDLLRSYSANPEKVSVVYPGLDAEWQNLSVSAGAVSSVRAKYGIARDYIISVGTIHPRKNYARLLEAFQKLPGNLSLVVVGKRGWLDREIFAAVERLDLRRRVCFPDYVRAGDLPALYAGARLAVMPSLYEGFGFPVLEAQACGTPVACSNSSSLPEVAGQAAEFFDPLKVEAMATAMSRLLTDDGRRAELIEKGLANIRRFSWARAAGQVLEAVKSASGSLNSTT